MQTTENYGLKKPESTDQYNIEDFNENMDILDKKLQEVFLRGNELKEMLVSNLVAYGIEADTSETFEVLFEKMATIETGVDTSDATATAAQILTGKTAYVDGAKVTGTMADKTGTTEYTATASLDATNKTFEMTVPAAGFYNTSNRLKATFATIASLIGLTSAKLASGNTILGISGDSNVVNTSAGTATAAQILTGKIAYVDGAKVTGTMATKAGTTVDASAVTSDDMYTYLTVPANAYYSTASKLRTLNSNLGGMCATFMKNHDTTTIVPCLVNNGFEIANDIITITKAGTYTVCVNSCTAGNGGASISIVVNNVVKNTYTHTVTATEIELAVGDKVKFTCVASTTSSVSIWKN